LSTTFLTPSYFFLRRFDGPIGNHAVGRIPAASQRMTLKDPSNIITLFTQVTDDLGEMTAGQSIVIHGVPNCDPTELIEMVQNGRGGRRIGGHTVWLHWLFR
jgi:hypothetical protein